MDSTLFFSTLNKATYLYDTQQSWLLHIHPIIRTVWLHSNKDTNLNLDEIIQIQYPDLAKDEISYYLKKYEFLKENGFFEEFDPDDMIAGEISSEIVERQIANIDNLLFQVTGSCNLKCEYCCYGYLYTDTTSKTPMTPDIVHKIFGNYSALLLTFSPYNWFCIFW